MKNNLRAIELGVSLALMTLTILLLDPFDFLMPDMMQMMILALTVAVFAVFAGFILREKVGDEREATHRMFAGRVAFLVGLSLLTIGIVVQTLEDSVDPWLVVVLVAMVLSKVLARIYSDLRQ